MKIEILYRNGHYHWVLCDGPDGADEYKGAADSIGSAMEQIISKRVENAHYLYLNEACTMNDPK